MHTNNSNLKIQMNTFAAILKQRVDQLLHVTHITIHRGKKNKN